MFFTLFSVHTSASAVFNSQMNQKLPATAKNPNRYPILPNCSVIWGHVVDFTARAYKDSNNYHFITLDGVGFQVTGRHWYSGELYWPLQGLKRPTFMPECLHFLLECEDIVTLRNRLLWVLPELDFMIFKWNKQNF